MTKQHDSSGSDNPSDQRTQLAQMRTDLAHNRTKMAHERTQRARFRTMLANERNFSAWLRSSLASIGVGLAVAELLRNTGAGLLARLIGVILVVLGLTMSAIAFWRYRTMTNILEQEEAPIMPVWVAGLMVGSLAVGSFIILMLILQ